MKKSCTLIIILAFILLGCGKDKVKPSADSILSREALDTIEAIKTAYQKKDRRKLQGRLGPGIAESTLNELYFEKVDLSFTPRMVTIDASTVMVKLNWQGTWVLKDKSIKNRGISDFVLEGSPMKVIRVDGDNPFHTPLARD
jgi:hypothetical protein